MTESPELSGSLWKTAAMRFAENFLGARKPYNQWDQMRLAVGSMKERFFLPPKENPSIYMERLPFYFNGQASSPSSGEAKNAPSLLDVGFGPVFRGCQGVRAPSCFPKMAERAGFEPAVPCGTQHFQCCTIGHSVTSPIKSNALLSCR